MTTLRLVRCVLCGKKAPERSSVRGTMGKTGAWFCKTCAADPAASVAKRRAK